MNSQPNLNRNESTYSFALQRSNSACASQTPKIQVKGPYPPFLGIITSNSVACHSQLRGVWAKLIPPFGMQLQKVRPDTASDVVTHESASQHHIVYQILRDVFGSRLIGGPTQKHSSSTSKK
jgi:hypothetical protein